MSNTTPAELMDQYEDAVNSSRVTAGRSDAIYHVGKLMTGEWTPEFVTSVQNELADHGQHDYDPHYHFGYLTAWNTVSGLLKGQSLKDIAKNHG